jgi:hypothetical protein
MSDIQDQGTPEKKVVVGVPVKSGISFKRVFSGFICGAFFFAIGYFWQDSIFIGIIFAVVAFLIGYFSGRAIY